ncbi:MAG TPA: hypothetical protein DCO72_06010 [Ruminococcus sp.]|nr:hypothetical protein [Ruminococcus sp.]
MNETNFETNSNPIPETVTAPQSVPVAPVPASGGFWGNLDKKSKTTVIIGAVVIFVAGFIMGGLFSGDSDDSSLETVGMLSEEETAPNIETLEVNPIGLMDAMTCPESCSAGKFGFYLCDGAYGVYFSGKEYDKVYLLETENGKGIETTADEGNIYGRDKTPWDYDTEIEGIDSDGDGYVTFTISVYTGDGYQPVTIVKGKK